MHSILGRADSAFSPNQGKMDLFIMNLQKVMMQADFPFMNRDLIDGSDGLT